MRRRLTYLAFLLLLISACGDDKSTPAPSYPPAEDKSSSTTTTESAPEPQSPAPVVEPEAPAADRQPTEVTTPAADDPRKESLELARKSGCLACHAVDRKVVGPAWKDVAKRYAGDAQARSRLVDKVSKGGRGNWTEVVGNVAMPPYSPRVPAGDIEKLVDFVLSLNNT